jgi:hypothetical protein
MYAEERLRERTGHYIIGVLGKGGREAVPRQQNSAVFFTYLGPWAGSKKPAFSPVHLGAKKS